MYWAFSIHTRAWDVLGFLGGNLKIASQKTKELAYFALVRPHVEYCATVWDPHNKKYCNKIEMTQRKAARFVTNRWGYKDSVTDMLNHLKWISLAERRKQLRLSMFYKIHHKLIPINFGDGMKPLAVNNNELLVNNSNYLIPLSNTKSQQYSFLPRTIGDWNILPNTVVDQPSVMSFKTALSNM